MEPKDPLPPPLLDNILSQKIAANIPKPHFFKTYLGLSSYLLLGIPTGPISSYPTKISYCDMWTVSKKRIRKHVIMERSIPGNQMITDHGFHGYENWKL
jgi:hypothetical protein